MTLEAFTILRKDELVAFFKALYGRRWRCIVARQVDMHPRAFERWRAAQPVSLYRQIHKLEVWARSIGFRSATDSEIQAALREDQQFKATAAQEVEKALSKRNKPPEAGEDSESHQLAQQIREAMKQVRAKAMVDAAPSSR
jgi:hypothetical protein